MSIAALARQHLQRLPFFYGWVVLGCAAFAAIARAGPAVATLSVFVEPMTRELGWSRTALSGAVSLGGVLAAITSPMIGTELDRRGPRLILCVAVATTGLAIIGLSQIHSLVAFYLLFCIARLNFAGPFDLGIYGAVSNWFVTRRALASSIVTLTQMLGLVMMPLVAHFAMQQGGWRTAWVAVGVTVLVVGFLPTWLFMVHRPEDVGLLPDGRTPAPKDTTSDAGLASAAAAATPEEPSFTRAQALRTRAFWMLGLFTAMVYPVQAGFSLHQVAHLMERGVPSGAAVMAVSLFSSASALSGVVFGLMLGRLGVRASLFATAVLLAASALAMATIATTWQGMACSMIFGLGLGGLHTILPVAWADTFGRRNFGAIRGVALTIQVAAQAAGPLISGLLRDHTGNYVASLATFAGLASLAALAALLIRPQVSVVAAPVGRDRA